MEITIFDYEKEKYGSKFTNYYDEKFVLEALTSTTQIQIALYKEIPIFRSRKNINESVEDVTNPKTFSYPDVQFCKENGRANIYGFPVFYASDNAAVTIMELRPDSDDILFIGEWHTKNNCETNISFNTTKEAIKNSVFKNLGGYIENERRKNSSIRNRLMNLFIEEQFPYPNSSTFSFLAMSYCNSDVIIYPSIRYAQIKNNLAIKAEYVDQNLELIRVFKIWIQVNSKTHFIMKPVEIGININGKILWEQLNDETMNYFKRIFNEGESCFLMEHSLSIEKLAENSKEIDIEVIKKSYESYNSEDIVNAIKNFKKGLELLRKKDYYRAINFFDISIKLCNFATMFYFQRGQCYYFLEMFDDALIDYSNAIICGEAKIAETDFLLKAYCNRGNIYQAYKKYDLAKHDFEKALEIDENDWISNYNLGNCYFEQNEFEMAGIYYDKALNFNPNNIMILEQKEELKKITK